jgi:hypothetical protein
METHTIYLLIFSKSEFIPPPLSDQPGMKEQSIKRVHDAFDIPIL